MRITATALHLLPLLKLALDAGADLHGVDLRGANLHGADLHGAKFADPQGGDYIFAP